MPRLAGTKLFLSSFYQGSLLLDIGGAEPTVVRNRRSKRKSEFEDGLYTTMCTPVIRDGHLYGMCGFGELRSLDLAIGDRQWETFATTEGKKSIFRPGLHRRADRALLALERPGRTHPREAHPARFRRTQPHQAAAHD